MTRILRFGKRIALAALIAGILLVVAQVVVADPPAPSFTYVADAAAPTTGCRSVTFTSHSTDPENDPLTIQWDFNNDGTFDDSGSSPTHVFGEAGIHQVRMRATNTNDPLEFTDITSPVDVPNVAPTAAFTISANPQAGQPITFTATGSGDTDGSIASYAWNFDDAGATGTSSPANHTYTDHLAHNPSLIVTDNCGTPSVAATLAQPLTPGNTPPQITTGPTATVKGVAGATVINPGDQVSFTALAADPNLDTPLTYTWNFGDGTPTETGETVQHTYPATLAAPSVNVTLQVSDGNGGTTPAALALTVNKPPVAKFANNPESPRVGEAVQFDALATTAKSTDPDGTISKYEWDFDGNGNWVEGPSNPKHVYNVAKKDINVGLRVTDNDGAVSAPVRELIDVNTTRPTAGLKAVPANPLPGQTVTLISTSQKDPQPWALPITATEWDFNYVPRAFTANARGPQVTTSFATAGVHTVAVHVFDGSGGDDTAYLPIVVNARPKASFTVRPSKPREGTAVTFISTSGDPDGPIVKQEWDLDNDGRYDDASGVVAAKKLKKGTRTVRLRVTDSKGATDTSAQQIRVAAKPLADAPQVIKTLGYAPRSWGIQVVALYVTVPARTTVKVTCKGRGCPHGKFVKRSHKKGTQLRFTKFRGLLRAGARITVVSYRSGSKAEYFTYTVRGDHKGPLKRKRCKALGAKKFGACG